MPCSEEEAARPTARTPRSPPGPKSKDGKASRSPSTPSRTDSAPSRSSCSGEDAAAFDQMVASSDGRLEGSTERPPAPRRAGGSACLAVARCLKVEPRPPDRPRPRRRSAASEGVGGGWARQRRPSNSCPGTLAAALEALLGEQARGDRHPARGLGRAGRGPRHRRRLARRRRPTAMCGCSYLLGHGGDADAEEAGRRPCTAFRGAWIEWNEPEPTEYADDPPGLTGP